MACPDGSDGGGAGAWAYTGALAVIAPSGLGYALDLESTPGGHFEDMGFVSQGASASTGVDGGADAGVDSGAVDGGRMQAPSTARSMPRTGAGATPAGWTLARWTRGRGCGARWRRAGGAAGDLEHRGLRERVARGELSAGDDDGGRRGSGCRGDDGVELRDGDAGGPGNSPSGASPQTGPGRLTCACGVSGGQGGDGDLAAPGPGGPGLPAMDGGVAAGYGGGGTWGPRFLRSR